MNVNSWMGVSVVAVFACPSTFAQVTRRVSVASPGVLTWGGRTPSISADGRFVAFSSLADNLVPGDTNQTWDAFVDDLQTGTMERASVDSAGTEANGESFAGPMSADGRYVLLLSSATNLGAGDSNGCIDVFVRDRQTGTTERVSVDSGGNEANGNSYAACISSDGRFVAFTSLATNLVPGDTNSYDDVFVRDRMNGTTERVSVSTMGAQGNGLSRYPSISGDGRFVAFESEASTLVPGDVAYRDIFVRDRMNSTTEILSVDPGGGPANNASFDASISADGRYVAFASVATNLVPGGTTTLDVYLRDRQVGLTERMSVDSNGVLANGGSYLPCLSGDGRHVTFESSASNLVPDDTNGVSDVFVHDVQNGVTERISVTSAGVQGDADSNVSSISSDGRLVAFDSYANNLDPQDSYWGVDVFLRDRLGGPDFTSFCDPGTSGVITCPCANPPSGPSHGCDNSTGTGGAILAAHGGTYLSSDSLVFTTSGERPSALSIVTQWTGSNPTGAIFGQGVRCTSGTFKRLYTKQAVAGSITAPDFGSGDVQVSVRSAALGDVLAAGQSRWHFVYYRDPNVLGGCPASSTFNCTQTGMVAWAP